jgi:hypothetical protein
VAKVALSTRAVTNAVLILSAGFGISPLDGIAANPRWFTAARSARAVRAHGRPRGRSLARIALRMRMRGGRGNGRSQRCREALGLERRFLCLLGQGAWPRYGVAIGRREGLRRGYR